MKILIACERFGKVRDAFRAFGHDAYSCDLAPDAEGSPFHFQEDCFAVMARGCWDAAAGAFVPWDMVIAHPTCTRLAKSGALRLYRGGKKAGGIDPAMWTDMEAGARFFGRFFELAERLGIRRLCVENPVQHGHAARIHGQGKPTQIVQPYDFAADASKATGLWLRGLLSLSINRADYVKPRFVCPACGHVSKYDEADGWRDAKGRPRCHRCPETPALLPRWANQTDSGQNKLPPSAGRAMARAKTYPGIARAMAQQWGR